MVPFPAAAAVVLVPVAGLTVAIAGARDSHVIGTLVPTLSCDVPVNSCVPPFVAMLALVGEIVNVAG